MDKVFFSAYSEFKNVLSSTDSDLMDLINDGACRKYHIHNLKLQNLSYLSGMMSAFAILDYGSTLERSIFYAAAYNMYEDSLKNMYAILFQKAGD